jgi:hypothetical protein
MGYEPYQASFDGYGPPPGFDDMEEVSAPGTTDPVVGTIPPAVSTSVPGLAGEMNVKPPGEEQEEDDMDDLRMLGIDVDDVAVVRR